MKLRVERLGKGPHGHPLLRIIGEGGPNDVNDVEAEDVEAFLAELRATAAKAGHTVEVQDGEGES